MGLGWGRSRIPRRQMGYGRGYGYKGKTLAYMCYKHRKTGVWKDLVLASLQTIQTYEERRALVLARREIFALSSWLHLRINYL